MWSYGIQGVAGEIIRDYLSGRYQLVSLGNETSRESVVTFGVPQGMVLGPLLFQIYLNDVFHTDIPWEIEAYADDTVLNFKGNDWDEAKQKSEKGLYKIGRWLEKNLLTLNTSKTKFLNSLKQIFFDSTVT